jgi:hypothetical protein
VAFLRGAGVAAIAMVVLYVAFDAGVTPAAPGTSAALLGLALVFGIGACIFSLAGRSERSPSAAGLAAGLALYAVLRIVLR